MSSSPSSPSASAPAAPSPTAPLADTDARAFVDDLSAFVSASPSSFHASEEAARRLEESGFTRLEETAPWTAESVRGFRFVVRDGAIIAWHASALASAATPFRIVGAHTDSPGLKLKPLPILESEGFAQAGVEIYGGPLLNSWLDRELEFAGRIVLRDGRILLARTGPVARVPQLAVHLDRAVNKDGLQLDPQRHMQPILALVQTDPVALLAESAGVDRDDVVAWDAISFPAEAPAVFGADDEFFASPRLDNLSSVHAGVRAIADVAASADPGADGPIAVLVANDHEEVGSATRSGAAGPFLEDVLARIHDALGGDDASHRRALASSMVLSCDAGHAAHPNYQERHDPVARPTLGEGPIIKINAQQRYATDAVGIAAITAACETAGVSHQVFVSNNAMPCGSTIGPITATRLGMTTIDAGITLLSMHSAREMCAVADPVLLARASAAFLRG